MAAKLHLIGHRIFKSSVDFPRAFVSAIAENTPVEFSYSLDVKAREENNEGLAIINVIGAATATIKDGQNAGLSHEVVRIDIEGGFKTEYNNCSLEEKNNLLNINAPAILLPYLRAFLTSVMAQANLPLLYFPVHNLVDRYNAEKKAEQAT